MLMYGSGYCSTMVDDGSTKIYNLCSMRECQNNIQILIPPNSIGVTFGREFDINYFHYVIDNDQVFVEFFRIIQDLMVGRNVYIMIGDDDWSENLCQSLLKIIQQRYGYNGYFITPDTDVMSLMLNDDTDFNKEWGLYNLDIDKYRYAYMIKMGESRLNPQGQFIMEQKYT